MRAFYLLLFLCLISAPVMAQEPDQKKEPAKQEEQKKEEQKQEQAKTLPEVTVQAKQEKISLTIPTLEEARAWVNLTPGGANVIDANTYKTGRASNLQDALGYSPGAYVQPRFGFEESRLSIRGSGIQRTFHLRGINMLLDGVPINEADGGGDYEVIDPLAYRYIEVYRGANALQYGSTTLGGAVNFVSPTGYNSNLIQGRFEYGSFDFIRSQVSSGQIIGPFDYYISLSLLDGTGFRDHSEQDNMRMYSNYGFRINPNLETRFYVTLNKSRTKLPGNLTKTQMDSHPEQAARGNLAINQKRDSDYIRVSNKTTIRFDEKQTLDLAAYWFRKDLYHPIFQVLDIISNNIGANSMYVNRHDLLSHKNIFILGFNPIVGLVQDNRYRNIRGARGARTAESDQQSANLDIFFEDQFYIFDKLAGIGGLQWSWASRKYIDHFPADGNHDGHPTYQQVSPKAGFRYEFSPDRQAYFNVSRSFEPPSFGELSNVAGGGIRDLKAQSAWTIEGGTRGTWRRLQWDISYYYSWVTHELLGLNNGAGIPLGTINAGDTIHQGVEFGYTINLFEGILVRNSSAEKIQKDLLKIPELPSGEDVAQTNPPKKQDRLVLHGIYNWSRFHFDNDPVYADDTIPGIPEHYFRAELMYEHPWGFYVGPNLEWTFEKYPVDMANTLFAPQYAILGLKGGYKTKRGLSFFVEARNLTDKIYPATTGVIADAKGLDSAQFLPGDGRSIYGGVELKF